MNKPIKFFMGSNTKHLLKKSQCFGVKLNNSSIVDFSDGEFEPSFDETVRGSHVFLVQSTVPPSDNLMELLLMIDAVKRHQHIKSCLLFLILDLQDKIKKES